MDSLSSSLLLIKFVLLLSLLVDIKGHLILSDFIKSGRFEEARQLAQVKLSKSVKSFSGYLTVNETHDSNLFFWFVPAQAQASSNERPHYNNGNKNFPVMLWLQGGPGTSSLFGLFVENGPFSIDSRIKLRLRDHSWTSTHSMLYIDSPVGTGFSFTRNEKGYSTTDFQVAQDLHNALIQFFRLFPEHSQNELYLAGESYAGKTVPILAKEIYQQNQIAGKFLNLKGVAIGGGFSDPVNMVTSYADHLYFSGLIGTKERLHFEKQGLLTQVAIREENYDKAYQLQDNLFGGDFLTYPPYFKNVTGFDYYYNLLESDYPSEPDYYLDYVQTPRIRRFLHVGNTPFHSQNHKVGRKLRNEIFKSAKSEMEYILNSGCQVLLFVGQLDIIIPHAALNNFIRHLQWKGRQGFEDANRKILRNSDDEILGYIQESENLKFVIVRNAGHHVPFDQPGWALDLIDKFTSGYL